MSKPQHALNKKVFVAIPLMDELENLPALLRCLSAQDIADMKVFFIVNQPEVWWDDEKKRQSCERNLESIDYLKKHADFSHHVIDRASKGKGWQGKQLGVGWARKVVMDAVAEEAEKNDIIVTLDGDTSFNENYFSTVRDNFNSNPEAVGLSIPYYHNLSGSEAEDKAILRYEIYMRTYAINMWRIGNPYHYTALGSAMAVPVSSYKAIGGMTPKKSGEDFYFLQKLRKYGRLMSWNEEKVYPAARFSDRVFFGTGPAMIKGASGDWNSYPVYHYSLFDKVKISYDAFDELYVQDIKTPLGDFMLEHLDQHDIWGPLRKNSRTAKQFSKACMDKVDGLRILQYLKHQQAVNRFRDELCLYEYFYTFQPELLSDFDFINRDFIFDELRISQLDQIRNALVSIEENYQKSHHDA